MRLNVSAEAEADIEEIADYIAVNNPPRAASFARELWAACEGLLKHPNRFRVLRTVEGNEFRQRMHGNYRIVYLVKADVVHVARILHSARDYERIPFSQD